MQITYNNNSVFNSTMVTFDGIPNILKITDTSAQENDAYVMFVIDKTNTSTNEVTITFEGDTIKSTHNQDEEGGKTFCWSYANLSSIATSLYNALLNCINVTSKYNIYLTSEDTIMCKSYENVINKPSITFSDNNWQTYMSVYQSSNQSYGEIAPYSPVIVNVMQGTKYVTTLEKKFYHGAIRFNLTPVLEGITEYGEANGYNLIIYIYDGNKIVQTKEITDLLALNGYLANQGQAYYLLGDSVMMLANLSRGNQGGYYNNMPLTIYQNKIDFSVLKKTSGRVSYTVTAYDGINNIVAQQSDSQVLTNITDISMTLNDNMMGDTIKYLVLSIDGLNIRYDIIRPLKAASYSERISWRNCMGGISFFDFTGSRTEAISVDSEEYSSSDLYFYEQEQSKHLYKHDTTVTVTIKSHMMDKDATYIFDDLRKSKNVWTKINGKKYNINVTNIQVTESNVEGVNQVTVTYKIMDNKEY